MPSGRYVVQIQLEANMSLWSQNPTGSNSFKLNSMQVNLHSPGANEGDQREGDGENNPEHHVSVVKESK